MNINVAHVLMRICYEYTTCDICKYYCKKHHLK